MTPSRLAVWLVAMVVFGSIVAAAAALGAGTQAAPAVPASKGPAGLPEDAAWERAMQLARDREARLATPEARAEREESRTAFRGLSDAQALGLARDRFPSLMKSPAFSGHEPAKGLTAVARPSKGTAVVKDESSGRRFLSVSSVPLVAKDDAGKDAPVDLSLRRTETGFAAQNPLVDVRIADRGAQVRFPDVAVGVAVAGASAVGGEATDDRVFFANADTDTDAVIVPSPGGAEVSWQLRSEDSPERLALSIDLPEGAVLRPATSEHPIPGDPPRSFEIARGDDKLGYVQPPVALDADGQGVPVDMRQEGDHGLVLSVAHRGRDLHYPLIVDPDVVVTGGPSALPGCGYPGWYWYEMLLGGTDHFGTAECDPSYGNGLYTSMPKNHWFKHGAHAGWDLRAPPNSYIYWVQFFNWQHDPAYNPAGASMSWGVNGILNPTATAWDQPVGYANAAGQTGGNPWTGNFAVSGAVHSFCYLPFCNRAAAHEQNIASIAIQAINPNVPQPLYVGEDKGWMIVEWTTVVLGDGHPPSITSSPDHWAYRPADRPWSKYAQSQVYVYGYDMGLGLKDITVSGATSGGIAGLPCDGNPWNGVSWCPDQGEFATSYVLPEGVNHPSVVMHDVVGNTSNPMTWTEKIDTSAPSVSLSGSLYNAAGPLRLTDGDDYGLTVNATDAYSGLQKIEIKVDGNSVSDTNLSCPNNQCPTSLQQPVQWVFHPEFYAAGDHTIQVIAHDLAGNPSTSPGTWTVKVTHAASTDLGPGSANLMTGNLQVVRSDVTIDSYATPLSVTRSYNSRHPEEPAGGPFGPGWLAGLPALDSGGEYARLEPSTTLLGTPLKANTTDPDGFITITTITGDQLGFDQNGDGTFSPAIGFEDLSLSYASGSDTFTLADTEGNETVFANDGNAAYRPSEVHEANSTNTTTYKYDSTGRITRVLAPTPPGVTSCTTMVAGCRALTFTYASATTASGTAPNAWGDFADRVQKIEFVAGTAAPVAVAQYQYDSSGRLRAAWDPRISPALKETYDYDAEGHLTTLAPPGEQPWTLAYASISGDANTGRVRSASRFDPALSQTATETVVYNVPTSGSAAPYDMTAASVGTWGQGSTPTQATAMFPEDAAPANPPTPTSYARSTVHYLDTYGRELNVAEPGGRISTTEYDTHDNIIRQLTAANRKRALTSANPATEAAKLDTRLAYSTDGVDLIDTLEPQHTVKLADGTTASARRHTILTYNEGAPTATNYHLLTTSTVGAQITGQSSDRDVRVTKMYYDGQSNLGWTLRRPTSVRVDPSGLNLTTTVLYDPATGLETERRLPANPGGGDAHARRTIYYTVAANTADSACGNKPDWAALRCKTLPAAQPTTGAPLPVATYEYNALNEVTKVTELAGTASRTTTTTYDGAGRKASENVTASEGTALPTITYGYDPATGRLTTTTSTDSSGTRTITRQYDALGRLSSYTDADGNIAHTTYDRRGRIVETSNAKGTQTRSYDSTTGDLTSLQDSALGTITATYDDNGQLKAQALPNGLAIQTTYDETGDATERKYVSGSNVLYDDVATASIHGQWLARTTTGSHQDYAYDASGRLLHVADARAGSCIVRDYTYDLDSNRTSLTRRPPDGQGNCATQGGTTTGFSYDAADRMTNGETYDAFGRTLSVPAGDAGGAILTSTYYVDDTVRSVQQGSVTHTYELDPEGRPRTDLATGATTSSTTSHYDDDSDEPSWAADGVLTWERYISGVDGDLIATSDATATKVQLINLHGDVVATATSGANPSASSIREADEFGNPPDTGSSDRFQWLGAKQRTTALPTGVVLMGRRVYNPAVGRFLQTDPVSGGSCNPYDYVCQDPANTFDLDGQCSPLKCVGKAVQKAKKTATKAAKTVKTTATKVANGAKRATRTVVRTVKRVVSATGCRKVVVATSALDTTGCSGSGPEEGGAHAIPWPRLPNQPGTPVPVGPGRSPVPAFPYP